MQFYENFDLNNIVTPVNHKILQQLLVESVYDKNETEFLTKGFLEGFDIGYEGPTNRQDQSQNIPIRQGVRSKAEMWNKIMKEVKEKRYAGLFEEIPFKNFIQSPIGLVPKAGGKTRLIFHLSYDFKDSGLKSLNHHTPKEKCSVRYNDIDSAVKNSFLWKDQKTGQIYYSKSDVQSAFRLVPLRRGSWRWIVMKIEHPITKKIVYFVDKCLPFGASISCLHF